MTVSPQGLRYLSLNVLRNSDSNEMTSNIHETYHLLSKYEDLDTRILLHALDATTVEYKRNVGKCHDTDGGNRYVYTVTVSPQGLQY